MKIKVRKIGNSIGVILPKTSGLTAGDVVEYSAKDDEILLSMKESQRRHDRDLIEDGFKDFETNNVLTEDEMKQQFGKYGWGK
ncbi:AbrB/MazE/SpoVT family DNA-binding domain-containing protein [Furfurilactobacillus siliginis]|uniref:AbrB family transcriptional regulator n=1 Tax=Furfurilactobacillus siliginis TaxID=348151 RepID=A0A0R2KXM5_9LACO|nr:hypothetical protein [Furfurilactobacillus siliginis]KRN94248.1 hypothetical protein IV55_GL000600 [Furfurilactobacillus siliginis]GEK29373.1 AbrB family transcriptional regulator [Furfurilactobacillus siliginis]